VATGLEIGDNNWFDYPDTGNPVAIQIDRTNATVFFRLISNP